MSFKCQTLQRSFNEVISEGKRTKQLFNNLRIEILERLRRNGKKSVYFYCLTDNYSKSFKSNQNKKKKVKKNQTIIKTLEMLKNGSLINLFTKKQIGTHHAQFFTIFTKYMQLRFDGKNRLNTQKRARKSSMC